MAEGGSEMKRNPKTKKMLLVSIMTSLVMVGLLMVLVVYMLLNLPL